MRSHTKWPKGNSQLSLEHDPKPGRPSLSLLACIRQTKKETEDLIKRKMGRVSSNSWECGRGYRDRAGLYFRPAVMLTHHCQELWPLVCCSSGCKYCIPKSLEWVCVKHRGREIAQMCLWAKACVREEGVNWVLTYAFMFLIGYSLVNISCEINKT